MDQLTMATETLAESRYYLQQGMLELLVPGFALGAVTECLRAANRHIAPSVEGSLTSVLHLSSTGAAGASFREQPKNGSYRRVIASSPFISVLLVRFHDLGAGSHKFADALETIEQCSTVADASASLHRVEQRFGVLEEAMRAVKRRIVAREGKGDNFLVSKVWASDGSALVAGPFFPDCDEVDAAAKSGKLEFACLSQLLEIALELRKSLGVAHRGSCTIVLTTGAASAVVLGSNPPEVDLVGYSPRQAHALMEAAEPGMLVLTETVVARLEAESHEQFFHLVDLTRKPSEPWWTRGGGLLRVHVVA